MSEDRPRLQPLSISQREALEEAVSSYERSITASAARLLIDRGIDQATAIKFRLGVVGDPHPGHERHRGKLVIPYLDRASHPLTVRFRCLHSMPGHPAPHDCRELQHGKYMSLADDPPRTFNIRAIHEAGAEIHIAEGEFDAMLLNRFGLPAIAIPGVQAWSGRHRRMLAGFNRQRVWGDPDDAGADFNRKVTQQLRNAKAVRLRLGDVTDTWMAGGAEALLSLIDDEGTTKS